MKALPPFVSHVGPVADPSPERVALVAMGASVRTYAILCAAKGGKQSVADEVWAVNAMGGVIHHDRLFVMDDIHRITEKAAERKPGGVASGMLKWLYEHPGPIYTSQAYPDIPGSVEYPLADVYGSIRHIPYLNTTVAYAVAFAIYKRVKELQLYGCDFSYPDSHTAESGRACVELLLGIAMERGMTITVAGDSTLFDASAPRKFYGYADPIDLTLKDGRWVLTRKPAATATVAAELEPAKEAA